MDTREALAFEYWRELQEVLSKVCYVTISRRQVASSKRGEIDWFISGTHYNRELFGIAFMEEHIVIGYATECGEHAKSNHRYYDYLDPESIDKLTKDVIDRANTARAKLERSILAKQARAKAREAKKAEQK